MSVVEVNKLRNDEISLKAMSASLLLLLRWFKASRKSYGLTFVTYCSSVQ
jgi:hypothetical protein